jgi:hydroxymethylpyrimidine/phosphomethylpyrimidine kinase
MRIALTIAGSDSGGGAGIQADLKTFQRFGVFGTSVITAITAQNTHGVTAWTATTPALVTAQIDAVATDLRPAAVKSGMLGSRAVIEAVAAGLRRHALAPYVLDPVMAATSGDALATGDAPAAIAELLLPLAALVTPNLDEAEQLTGRAVRDVDAMTAAARELVARGAGAALVKGGHLASGDVADVLYHEGAVRVFRHPRIDSTSTHGTGCALSAAITAHLALGTALPDAVERSLALVQAAISSAPGLGSGHGPLDFHAGA